MDDDISVENFTKIFYKYNKKIKKITFKPNKGIIPIQQCLKVILHNLIWDHEDI